MRTVCPQTAVAYHCIAHPQARWRRGESVSLKAARDSMVSLEVAAHSQLALGKGSNNLYGNS